MTSSADAGSETLFTKVRPADGPDIDSAFAAVQSVQGGKRPASVRDRRDTTPRIRCPRGLRGPDKPLGVGLGLAVDLG